MRAMAPDITLTPTAFEPVPATVGPPSSGGLVIRKIFRRSNGAVHVRETIMPSQSTELSAETKMTHQHQPLRLLART